MSRRRRSMTLPSIAVMAWLLLLPHVSSGQAFFSGPGYQGGGAAVTFNRPQTWSALQTFSSGIVSPSVIGGTGTTSTLTLQSTSGVGTTGADIIFKVGNNGATEAMRLLNAGTVRFLNNAQITAGGNSTPTFYMSMLQVDSSSHLLVGDAGNGNGTIIQAGPGVIDFTTSVGVSATTRFSNAGFWGIGTTAPASLLDLRAGDLTFSGANGQKYVQGRLTELTSIGSGVTTATTTIQIPADAIVYAVPVRVITQPGGTTTMTVTATTSATAFQKGANISTAAGTTDPGTKNTPVNYNSVAAQTITFTFNVATTNAAGQIRVDVYYATSTPPTS